MTFHGKIVFIPPSRGHLVQIQISAGIATVLQTISLLEVQRPQVKDHRAGSLSLFYMKLSKKPKMNNDLVNSEAKFLKIDK